MAQRQRKYPGVNRGTLRPDRKAKRRAEALERQAAAAARSPEEQMEVLEARGQDGGPEYAKLRQTLNRG